jgi:hypothetical protein
LLLSRSSSGAYQARNIQLFEELTHKQLVETQSLRPGFVAKPAIGGAALVRERGESTQVDLSGGRAISVGPVDAYGSDRLGLMIYLRVTSGAVLASLEVETDAGIARTDAQRFTSDADQNYRLLRWIGSARARQMTLRIVPEGDTAVVRVRDLYPFIENPHVASID